MSRETFCRFHAASTVLEMLEVAIREAVAVAVMDESVGAGAGVDRLARPGRGRNRNSETPGMLKVCGGTRPTGAAIPGGRADRSMDCGCRLPGSAHHPMPRRNAT